MSAANESDQLGRIHQLGLEFGRRHFAEHAPSEEMKRRARIRLSNQERKAS